MKEMNEIPEQLAELYANAKNGKYSPVIHAEWYLSYNGYLSGYLDGIKKLSNTNSSSKV